MIIEIFRYFVFKSFKVAEAEHFHCAFRADGAVTAVYRSAVAKLVAYHNNVAASVVRIGFDLALFGNGFVDINNFFNLIVFFNRTVEIKRFEVCCSAPKNNVG